MDWSRQFRVTDNFKNRAANIVEFIFGFAFLHLNLFAFGRGAQFLADKINPGHSFENEYSLLNITPYFIPVICGIVLTAYSYIVGVIRNKRFALRSKTARYIFLGSFIPVFLSTLFVFVYYFYLLDESRLVETRVEEFSYAAFFGIVLFGMVSIALSTYIRNKSCSGDSVKAETEGKAI